MAKFEFGFEEVWFRLIIKNLAAHPDLFMPSSVEKAQRILRMGKLKVGAARAWGEAAGLITKKKGQFLLTTLGQLIAHHDPDMDDDGIWWALHYNLARQGSPAWFYAFYCNEFSEVVFDRSSLEKELRSAWDREHENQMTDSVFDKLVFSPLKQVFEGTRIGKDFGLFDLRADGLIYQEPPGSKQVPAAIFGFALLDWAKKEKRQSVYLEKLLRPWGVGRIFRLDRGSLDRILVEIGEAYSKKVGWISHTAGLNSVSLMDVRPLALISAHYHQLDGIEPQAALQKGLSEIRELEKSAKQMSLFQGGIRE